MCLVADARLDVPFTGSFSSFFLSSRIYAPILQLIKELMQAVVLVNREEEVAALLGVIVWDEMCRRLVLGV